MGTHTSEEIETTRRITRATLKSEPDVSSTSPLKAKKSSGKKSKSKKKVKFQEPKDEVCIKNTSLVSDEGIDMSYTPHLNLPASISRPQHKLRNNWSYWYASKNKKNSWSQNQNLICTMATIEDFFHCHNQVKQASKLPAGHTYAVFKKGIIPDWEDKANVEGGRWMISYDRKERFSKLDDRWMEALLMTLGEHMDKCVNGIQVCVRGNVDRVEVWLGKTSNMREMAEVGRKVKQQLGIGAIKMEFSIHMEEKEGFKGPCLMI